MLVQPGLLPMEFLPPWRTTPGRAGMPELRQHVHAEAKRCGLLFNALRRSGSRRPEVRPEGLCHHVRGLR